ncbi:MAG: (Fe-S)-binding protein [Gammaproteobacteria bacterium]|nr:(Fe-S)-binding protein [Gammaproteobacteria bacterium]
MSSATAPGADDIPAQLAEFARDYYHCADCSYCVDATWAERGLDHVCPTIMHHRPVVSWSGRGYLLAARAWFEGAAIDEGALAERVFACTGCGHCEAVCPIGLRPAQIGASLRAVLVARGHAPEPVAALRAAMRTHGNPYALSAASRVDWAAALAFADDEATLLYAPGCAAAWRAPGEAVAQVRVMQAAGERVAWRGAADRCCGGPLREAGCNDDAAQAEAALVRGLTTTRVVVGGLECAPGWRRAATGRAGVHTFGEWLREILAAGRLRIDVTAGLRVHAFDGCAARRPDEARVDDPLREILARCGITPVNDAHGSAHAVCCGAAGTMSAVAGESALRMAAARLVAPAQADVIVVGDPRCRAHLEDAARSAPSAPVLGLAEFLTTHTRIGAPT